MDELAIRGEFLSGHVTRERKLALCSGSLPLSPEERVELLAVLAVDLDAMIAERAAGTLVTQPRDVFLKALTKPDVAQNLLVYCAKNLPAHPGIADLVAQKPNCPAEALIAVARYLSPPALNALLEDMGRLSEYPEVAAALAESTTLTAEQRKLLEELQQMGDDSGTLADAIAAAEPDAVKRETLLQRLTKMRVIERVKLALTGNREERMVLIRDISRVVQRAVLQSPKLSDTEVETFSAMTNITEETLRLISKNRSFMKNYQVVRHLLSNPKTPLDVTLHLLPRLNAQDLKFLTLNRNIPETLRSTAQKLMRQRSSTRPGSGE